MQTNLIIQRCFFHQRSQKKHETIQEYIVALQTLADKCEFKSFQDDSLRDQFVIGLNDEHIRQNILKESPLNFKKACQLALGHESVNALFIEKEKHHSDIIKSTRIADKFIARNNKNNTKNNLNFKSYPKNCLQLMPATPFKKRTINIDEIQ